MTRIYTCFGHKSFKIKADALDLQFVAFFIIKNLFILNNNIWRAQQYCTYMRPYPRVIFMLQYNKHYSKNMQASSNVIVIVITIWFQIKYLRKMHSMEMIYKSSICFAYH